MISSYSKDKDRDKFVISLILLGFLSWEQLNSDGLKVLGDSYNNVPFIFVFKEGFR